ncbi:MAG: SCP2 sterol-binding domain-containing protein [Saprospiraceae bacterium]|nr:SCP2 sterol-binding domain-containing protein [Saprospiraceae bacterium]
MTTREFLLHLPEKVDVNALTGMSACFHFILSGEEGGNVTVKLEDGRMTTTEGITGIASCVIKADADDLKKVFKGELNPMLAILKGKLKISNQGEMMKFAKLLGWM